MTSTLQSLDRRPLNQGHQGAYGPLRPPTKAKIPLWMAMNLKMKKKCHIVPPDWLSVGAPWCKPFGGLLTRVSRFSSGKISTGNKPPGV